MRNIFELEILIYRFLIFFFFDKHRQKRLLLITSSRREIAASVALEFRYFQAGNACVRQQKTIALRTNSIASGWLRC